MSELVTLHHNNGRVWREYHKDKNGKRHGEYKSWYRNGQMRRHYWSRNNTYHSEFKGWDSVGQLQRHSFYAGGRNITSEVRALVQDMLNISDEEKLLIKLTWGIPCLPK